MDEDGAASNGKRPPPPPPPPPPPNSMIEALKYTPFTSLVTTQDAATIGNAIPKALPSGLIDLNSALTPDELKKSERTMEKLGQNVQGTEQITQQLSKLLNSQKSLQWEGVPRTGEDGELSPWAETMLNQLSQSEEVMKEEEELSLPQSPVAEAKPVERTIPLVNSRQDDDHTPISNRKISIAVKQTVQERIDDAETEFFDFVTTLLDSNGSGQGNFWTSHSQEWEPSLSNMAMERLQTLLWKLKGTNALQENTGQVVELYNLLKRPVALAQVLISQQCASGVGSQQDISRLIPMLDNALKSAKLILELYYIGHDEPSLIREDLLLEVVEFLAAATNKVFISLAGQKGASGSSDAGLELAVLNRALKNLYRLVKVADLGSAMHQIQYLCGNVVFATVENTQLKTGFQPLVYTCISLVTKVFEKSNERDVIIREMLTQTDQLSPKMPQKFAVAGGNGTVMVHNFSALVLNLLQVSGSGDKLEVAKSAQNQCFVYSRQIISYLFENATSGNTNNVLYRALLETLVGDLLAVVYNPRYPASDSLIMWVVNELYQVVGKKASAKGTVLALDLLGTVANGLVDLRQHERVELRENVEKVGANFHRLMGALGDKSARKFIKTEFINMLNGVVEIDPEEQLVKPQSDKSEENKEDDEGLAKQCYVEFLCSRQLSQCYDTIIQCIIQALSQNSKVKTAVSKALKMLTKLADANPEVLGFGQVQAEVKNMLRDDSSQVRDSAIALVASYLKNPNLYSFYFDVVLERAHSDTGLAPRKRAINSLNDLYPDADSATRRKIVRCLLAGIDDEEDSIQKLVRDLLDKNLFADWPAAALGDATHSLAVQNERKLQVASVAGVIAAALDDGRHEKQFLAYLSDPQHISDMVKQRLEIIVDELVDDINSVEDPDQSLRFLSGLARANPLLITPNHLRLLQAFPVEERNSASTRKTRYYSLVVFRHALRDYTGAIDVQFLTKLKDMLLKRLSAYGIAEINEGVPCLWSVVKLLGNDSAPMAIARAYKNSMSRVKTMAGDANKVLAVRRLCFIIGCIGRYCDLGNQSKLFDEKLASKSFKQRCDAVAMLGIQCLMQLLTNPQDQVQKAAVQNIGQICIGNPDLFQSKQVEQLFDRILNSDTQESLKDLVMKTLTEFVELDVVIADEVARKRAKEKTQKVDISGNANNLGSSVVIEVAQKYKDLFKQVALSSENESAYTAARLLNLIGKQGLTAPQEVASVIIALMSATKPAINALAKNAFEKMFHKHESTLPSQTQQGIKLAAETRRRLVGDALMTEKDGLKNMYTILHPPNGRATTSAKRFFTSAIRAAKPPDVKPDQLMAHLDFCAFLANSISCLNIAHPDEVNTVISEITEALKLTSESVDQLYSEYENGMLDEERSLKLGIMSAGLLCLWHLRKFLRASYTVNGKLSAPKLNPDHRLNLVPVINLGEAKCYPGCNAYTTAFHEAMELEFDQPPPMEEEQLMSPTKRRISGTNGDLELTPTKRIRFDEV